MTRRTQVDFEEIYAAPEDTAGPDRAGDDVPAGERTAAPDPDRLASARAEVERAEQRAEEARVARDAAEDALADLEAEVAVLETKVEDYDRDEAKQPWQRKAAQAELAKAQRAFRRAGQRFERAETQLAAAMADADAAVQELQGAGAAVAEEPVVLRFASLAVFVEQYVLPNWVHRLGDNYAGRWCAQWWEHAEAITRLEAVWEAFEVMRLQPAPSLSTWIRDHLDPHMRMLTANDGVFWRCEVAKHKDPIHAHEPAWPAAPAPQGLFAVDATATVQGPKDAAADNQTDAGGESVDQQRGDER